jgi:sugar (pentulose or hexulose) kinase
MKEKVIAIFDVGKTNKKLLLFDEGLKIVSEAEEKFPEITDDDGFPCDDIEKIENWIISSVKELASSEIYDLAAVNFATYGATLVYVDGKGRRVGPVYNYLKPIEERIPERVYRRHGGQDEFCRQTASPALGMLNSGMQALWLKNEKPEVFAKVKHILHFPQYLSYLLTGKVYSEHTSIGCHTAIWDFDNSKYHGWTEAEGLKFPEPVDIGTVNEITIGGRKIFAGIGIHDSSSSLAPYFAASKGNFVLISTGTWCINMNPFNSEKLTTEQLDRDCLCYMSITKQPVKSSRLFMGHLHDTALEGLNAHFEKNENFYKSLKPDNDLIEECRIKSRGGRIFFTDLPFSREVKLKVDYFNFKTFEEGYTRLMVELSDLAIEAINLVIPEGNHIENIYITGGFSKNPFFVRLISQTYSMKNVYTSEINNATALGAALVILGSVTGGRQPSLNLGLSQCQK